MTGRVPDEIQEIIVRFASSIPDVCLAIDAPRTTTALTLKTLIRKQLPVNLSSNRLSLIYLGKIIPNTEPLFDSLRLLHRPPPPPPPPPKSTKGKEPIHLLPSSHRQLPIYIHCSIGDALSPAALAAEAQSAANADRRLLHAAPPPAAQLLPNYNNDDASTTPLVYPDALPPPPLPPPPRAPLGFDSLLGADFTAQDVATLRASLLAHLAHTHTPDRMPTGDALRALEERWLETSAGEDAGGVGGGGGNGGDGDEASALDDMLWGSIMGFFWPVGLLLWGVREDGIWTQRRQMAMLTGLMLNVAFGLFRLAG